MNDPDYNYIVPHQLYCTANRQYIIHTRKSVNMKLISFSDEWFVEIFLFQPLSVDRKISFNNSYNS